MSPPAAPAVVTNLDRLIAIAVAGEIAAPRMPALPAMPHVIARDGRPRIVPALGGIVYNVRVGDPALGWVAEHVHPGVSITHREEGAHVALHTLACVGNEAVVMSGEARGATGTVTGKSGRWSEHVIIYFAADVLERLAIGDRVLVRAHGVGLAFPEHPDVLAKNLSPRLLAAWGLGGRDGVLDVPVVGVVPPELMGAGSGLSSDGGVLDIQTGMPDLLKRLGLANLRLGDLVAFQDCDATFNSGYHRGAVSVGVVSEGDSQRAGFGTGVTILLTSRAGAIRPIPQPSVNIADLLELRG
ncbi:MAG: DUF4438 domain-containing protein [Armatimonadota bacterium]|nr:DUF4438 domain-containing protein [Armatimonadota bacterium]MDR7491156.1 DUF4438 domain-containing protein [Armatimonadota bacterium]MDR7528337.1 DUF4438 domain-containing protein [Armatimonadota bacterium]MDR7543730.1 DUF4438 domain-containing protein [Armatimonadota bacterium]MDR7573777.1 DUF4438 domain-containing protein [Armatimonadota bacterium]